MGIADRTGVAITRPGPNTVAFTGFGFQPSVQVATVAGRTPDTAPRSVTLALVGGGPSVWSAPVTIPAGSTSATGPALILGAGTYTLTGTPPAGGPFGVGTQTGIDPSAIGAATVTVPYTAVMLTVTAQVGTTPRADATVTVTPATGTGPARARRRARRIPPAWWSSGTCRPGLIPPPLRREPERVWSAAR